MLDHDEQIDSGLEDRLRRTLAAIAATSSVVASHHDALKTGNEIVTVIDATSATTKPTSSHRSRTMLAMAAAVSLIIGVLALAWRHDTDPIIPAEPGSTVPAAPTTNASAAHVATRFLEATARFDASGVAALLSDGVLGSLGGLEGLRLQARWAQGTGFELIAGSCDQQDGSTSGINVTCAYDFQALWSDEMGLGPFSGSTYTFTIVDGTILSVSEDIETEANGFSSQVWEPFAQWVSATYPDDVAIMYTDSSLRDYRLTDNSIQLWEQHSREYLPFDGNKNRHTAVANRPVSYVLADGWEPFGSYVISGRSDGRAGAEAMIFWAGFDEGTYADPCLALPHAVEPYTPGDVAVALATMPGTELISGPSDVIVGGIAAKHVALTVRQVPDCDPAFFYNWKELSGGAMRIRTEVGDTINVWIVNVYGPLLFVASEAHPDAKPGVEQQIHQIVASVAF